MTRLLLTLMLLFTGSVALAAVPDYRVLVLGDFNGPYGSLDYPAALSRVLDHLPQLQPDLVLMPGDLVAGQDTRLPDERFGQMWAAFDTQVADALRRAAVPWAAAMGNHDASGGGPTYARERQAAAAYWNTGQYLQNLDYVDATDRPFNYSFRTGPVFIAVWDATTASISAEQLEWLTGQLASPQAQGASHRWLVGHLPLTGVAVGRDAPGEVLHDGAGLAVTLQALGIDTYISGHQAAYYPARLGGLELLNSGGIGARRLLAGDAAPRSAFVLVDVLADGSVSYTGIDADTLEPVDPASLPAFLDTSAGRLELSGRANGSIIGP